MGRKLTHIETWLAFGIALVILAAYILSSDSTPIWIYQGF
jgi:hypothetical protein